MSKKLSPYLKRLKAVDSMYESITHHSEGKKTLVPKVVFLDIEQGVTRAGDAIAEGWPVVTDYGSTYGTAFPPQIRQEIALARKETAPLATVSLVTTRELALEWMDIEQIDPTVAKLIKQGKLEILEGISFIRFPASQVALKTIDPSCINQQKEIQVFVVPADDPLMLYLNQKHHIPYIAVRSSNITGKLEETSVKGAMQYASEIGAPLFVMRSLNSFYMQIEDEELRAKNLLDKLHRKRVGSQPILQLPNLSQGPVLTLTRAGNTHPETFKRLLKDFTDAGVTFVDQPEKAPPPGRTVYEVDVSITDPLLIKRLLLQAANLL